MTVKVDRRRLLLDRLEAILSSLTITLTTGTIPAGNFVRNRDELPEEKVPGIILLDADETRDPRYPSLQGRSERMGPGMMKMTPEIYVVLDVRKPQNKNVGEDLLTARGVILDAVAHDPTLQQITGSSGGIIYDGCYTDLARNRQMRGQMGLMVTFGYPFVPDEFAPA